MLDFVMEYLPVVIVGAIIGSFAVVFLIAYAALQKHKETLEENERHMADSEIIRRLIGYAKPYWKNFVIVFFVMLFSIVYDLISPLLIGHIQETISGDFELSYLFTLVAVYAGVLVVSLICTYLQAMILQRTGQKILSQIRLDVSSGVCAVDGLSSLRREITWSAGARSLSRSSFQARRTEGSRWSIPGMPRWLSLGK